MQLISNRLTYQTRRRFLKTGSAAFLLSGLSDIARGQDRQVPARPARLLGRWPTGNRHLAPPGIMDDGLILAGDRATERWNIAPGRAQSVWSRPIGDGQAHFRPRVDGNLVLVSGRGFLAVHALDDGRLLWRQAPKGEEFSVPLIANGRLYVGDGFTLRCLEAMTGHEVWSAVIDSTIRIHYAPALRGGVVYLCPGDGVLYAFEATGGRKLWSVDKSETWQYLRQLHFWNDVLVGGGYHDEVWGLDGTDGRVLWRFVAGNFVNSHLVAGQGVYFWSPTGWIYKLNPSDGRVAWRHRTIDYVTKRDWNWAPLMAELMAAGDRLFCLDMKHTLHVLDIGSGDETHRLVLPPVRAFVVPGREGKDVWAASLSGELLNAAIDG